jgi:hypothetical protein
MVKFVEDTTGMEGTVRMGKGVKRREAGYGITGEACCLYIQEVETYSTCAENSEVTSRSDLEPSWRQLLSGSLRNSGSPVMYGGLAVMV